MVKQVRFVWSLFTDGECFKQKSGAKTTIYRGGGQVLADDVVIKALSYRNPLSLLIFHGRGGGFRTHAPYRSILDYCH